MTTRKVLDWLTVALIYTAVIFAAYALFVRQARAQTEPSAEDRAAFFLRMKNAQLVGPDPKTRDCCGVGDFTLVKVVGSAPGGLVVEVTDPRKHGHAKKGARVVVPRSAFVKHEASPWGVPGLFISNSQGLYPYCFVGAGGS